MIKKTVAPPPTHIARNSGIELLKVFAVYVIIVTHYINTLVSPSSRIADDSYIIHLDICSASFQNFILTFMRYFGMFGNTIFFICSSWFFTESKHTNKKKIIGMALDIWCISVITLVIGFFFFKGKIGKWTVISSLFPTTFGGLWYTKCYILFLSAYPFLNIITHNLGQREHLRLCLAMSFLYIIMSFIKKNLFFGTSLMTWIAIYFFISYAKLYLGKYMESLWLNLFFAIGGTVGCILLVLLTNILGIHISFFSDKIMRWISISNPFIIFAGLGMLNLVRKIEWRNSVVNYLSSLSLFIYLIHEDIIFGGYFRPLSLSLIHSYLGYEHIIVWIFIVSAVLFIICTLISMIYKETIRRLLYNIINANYSCLRSTWCKVENKLIVSPSKDRDI